MTEDKPKTKQKKPTSAYEIWPIERPIPYARNPRKITEEAVAGVAGSIKEFGFKQPIVVDSEGVIIMGHTRLKAAQRLGLTEVPVLVASDLTPTQCQALRLTDNRVGEFSEWDNEMLKLEIEDLGGAIDLQFAGFDDLLGSLGGEGAEGENPYTGKIETPIYKPTGEKPAISELCDVSKTIALIEKIDAAKLPDDISQFLRIAAGRHTKFDYQSIAEYYAHAPTEIQALFEESVLVIIDFKKAIELGFVRLAEDVAAQYQEEYPDEE
jgi:hypothetical protein